MNNSLELKKKIDEFKGKIVESNDYMVFEPNSFDLFIDKIVLKINHQVDELNNNKMIKNILTSTLFVLKKTLLTFWGSLKNITEKINLIKSKFDQLEKKIENQQGIINESLNTNNQIKNNLEQLFKSVEKLSEKIQINSETTIINNKNDLKSEDDKVKFYQEENVRLGGELLETKKKFNMVKSEIEKYEQQRSNLISKINSVNDALNDTNVFSNDVKLKVNVIDHKKKEFVINNDMNEQIKNIFSKSN